MSMNLRFEISNPVIKLIFILILEPSIYSHAMFRVRVRARHNYLIVDTFFCL
jgi:hypothetical protein